MLDEYLVLLPEDSTKSIRTLQFIAEMAPVIGSKADNALRRDPQLFNRAWYSMDLKSRMSINGSIIHKSMSKAIKEKNKEFAYRTASFARGTYNDNFDAGLKAFEQHMLNFYRGTKDTASFLVHAIPYYERFYMSVNVDSVKRFDSMAREQSPRQHVRTVDTIVNGRNAKTMISSVAYSPRTQFFTQDLNNGAWSFYKMTNDPDKLNVALNWIERGLQFYESPEALDTYARLLYKLNKRETAIDILNKAIALERKEVFPQMNTK